MTICLDCNHRNRRVPRNDICGCRCHRVQKMNLGHFCDPDPERNHFKGGMAYDTQGNKYPDEFDNWPRHYACSGKEIINFGAKNEQIVKCDCPCHWVTINPKEKED